MLNTEKRNPKTKNIDKMSSHEMIKIIHEEYVSATLAVESELDKISRAIDEIAARMARGGRLFYIGAGTSGRLGVLDASECPPTFNTNNEMVQGIIAGGDKCLRSASENAEDNFGAGQKDLKDANFCEKDVVVAMGTSADVLYNRTSAKGGLCFRTRTQYT